MKHTSPGGLVQFLLLFSAVPTSPPWKKQFNEFNETVQVKRRVGRGERGGRGVFLRDRIVTFELVWFGRFPQCSIWLYTRLLICGRNFQAQRPAKKFKLGLLFSSLDLGRLLKQLTLKWRSKEPIKVIKSCPTHDKSGMVFNKYFHSARNVILFLIRVIFALWHENYCFVYGHSKPVDNMTWVIRPWNHLCCPTNPPPPPVIN